jgi:hypothetical protein
MGLRNIIIGAVLAGGALGLGGKAVYDAGVREAGRITAAERAERARSIDALTKRLDAEIALRTAREQSEALFRQRMTEASRATYLILNTLSYDITYEEKDGQTGEWKVTGNEQTGPQTGRGNGVAIARKDGAVYLITDAHLLAREHTEYHPFRPDVRRTLRPRQELRLVTQAGRDAGALKLDGLPLQVLAYDDHDHALLATSPEHAEQAKDLACISAVGSSAALAPRDPIYSVSRLVNDAVELPNILKLDELLIEYHRQGIVESMGDPTSPTDDAIRLVKFDVQAGMSGSGVYNARGELVGLAAYRMHNNGDAIRTSEGIIEFLRQQGYGGLLERK